MIGLTSRQRECLGIIEASIATRGMPPTLREIGVQMGIHSTNGVNDHLRALERKGYISKTDGLSRAVRVRIGTNGAMTEGAPAPGDEKRADLTTVAVLAWHAAVGDDMAAKAALLVALSKLAATDPAFRMLISDSAHAPLHGSEVA